MFILKWFYSIKIRTYYIYIVLVWKIITCSWEELFAYYIENVQPLIFNAMLLEIIKISSSYKDLYLIQTLFNQHSANSSFSKKNRNCQSFFLFFGRHHYRWRVANFDICSVLLDIEQWVFIYCDTGHPFIMVISEDPWYSHQSVAERVAVELSLPVLTT